MVKILSHRFDSNMPVVFLVVKVAILFAGSCDLFVHVRILLWPRELRSEFVPTYDNSRLGLEEAVDVFERSYSIVSIVFVLSSEIVLTVGSLRVE